MSDETKKKPLGDPIPLRFEEDQISEIHAAATASGLDRTDVIRLALGYGLPFFRKHHSRKPSPVRRQTTAARVHQNLLVLMAGAVALMAMTWCLANYVALHDSWSLVRGVLAATLLGAVLLCGRRAVVAMLILFLATGGRVSAELSQAERRAAAQARAEQALAELALPPLVITKPVKLTLEERAARQAAAAAASESLVGGDGGGANISLELLCGAVIVVGGIIIYIEYKKSCRGTNAPVSNPPPVSTNTPAAGTNSFTGNNSSSMGGSGVPITFRLTDEGLFSGAVTNTGTEYLMPDGSPCESLFSFKVSRADTLPVGMQPVCTVTGWVSKTCCVTDTFTNGVSARVDVTTRQSGRPFTNAIPWDLGTGLEAERYFRVE